MWQIWSDVLDQTSEMGDTHIYFIRPVAPTPRSEPSKLEIQQWVQEKFISRMEWHYGKAGIINNATDNWRKRF